MLDLLNQYPSTGKEVLEAFAQQEKMWKACAQFRKEMDLVVHQGAAACKKLGSLRAALNQAKQAICFYHEPASSAVSAAVREAEPEAEPDC